MLAKNTFTITWSKYGMYYLILLLLIASLVLSFTCCTSTSNENYELLNTIQLEYSPKNIIIKNGKIFVKNGYINIWDRDNFEKLHKIEPHLLGYSLSALAVSSTGKIVCGTWSLRSGGGNMVWNSFDGELINNFERYSSSVSTVALLEDKIICSGLYDGRIILRALNTGKILGTLNDNSNSKSYVTALAVKDKRLIAGSSDNTLAIWNFSTQKKLKDVHTLKGHTAAVTTLDIYRDKIVSGSEDTTIKIWDLESGELQDTLTGHTAEVTSLSISNGKIFSASYDKTIKVWDLNTGKLIDNINEHPDTVTDVAASGNLLVSDGDHKLKFWRVNY